MKSISQFFARWNIAAQLQRIINQGALILSGLQHLNTSVDTLATDASAAFAEMKTELDIIKANGGQATDAQLDLLATKVDGVDGALAAFRKTVADAAGTPPGTPPGPPVVEPPAPPPGS